MELRECLMKKSTEELWEIGFRMMVPPPENLRSRAAWCELLLPELSEPKKVVTCLYLGEWDALSQRFEQRSGEALLTFSAREVNRDLALYNAMHALWDLGLAWRDRHAMWHLQPIALEAAQLTRTERRVFEKIEWTYSLLMGCLRLYGMMTTEALGKLLTAYGAEGLLEVMTDFHRKREGSYGIHSGKDRDEVWLINPDVNAPEKLYQQLQSPEAQEKTYARYDLEELIRIGEGGLPGRSDAYDEAYALYESLGVAREDALDALSSAICHYQNDEDDEAMQALMMPLERIPTPNQLRTLTSVLLRIPMWPCKGRCAEDMLPSTMRMFDRVRQDDPCPCGSGRKYKHCCGRLQ